MRNRIFINVYNKLRTSMPLKDIAKMFEMSERQAYRILYPKENDKTDNTGAELY